jgi:hypothetical protein
MTFTRAQAQATFPAGPVPHNSSRRTWTVQAVRDLGLTTDVQTAGAVLGIGRSKAYKMAKDDQFPVRLLHIGRRYVVPVAAILQLLGAD